jgi:hypothetical protein
MMNTTEDPRPAEADEMTQMSDEQAVEMPALLTPDQKRAKVRELLESPAWAVRSDRAIAAQAGTSPPTVAKVRRELAGIPEPVRGGSDIETMSAGAIRAELEAISRSWTRVADSIVIGREPQDALLRLESRRLALAARLPVAEAMERAHRSQSERVRAREQRRRGLQALAVLEERATERRQRLEQVLTGLDAEYRAYVADMRSLTRDVALEIPPGDAHDQMTSLRGALERLLDPQPAIVNRLAVCGFIPGRKPFGEMRRAWESGVSSWIDEAVRTFARQARKRLPDPDRSETPDAPQTEDNDPPAA